MIGKFYDQSNIDKWSRDDFIATDNLDRVARRKWRTKLRTSELRGLSVNITYDQYKDLMVDAGIQPNQIGTGEHDYCLARYKDLGHYTLGNCRFITNHENMLEQIESCKLLTLSENHGSYESCKGQKHYKSKGIICTPNGEFETIRQGANACNISHATLHRWLGKKSGYYYKPLD
jgi:hypothetical protein